MFFSIIVVSLNPGDKLLATLDSISKQSFIDYEVVIKDGGSKDGTPDRIRHLMATEFDPQFSGRIHVYEQADRSIYEGMNQAVGMAKGNICYFLNCGDIFYDGGVLQSIYDAITAKGQYSGIICYGDIYDALRDTRVVSNPKINGFACYRNVPCHQACFYSRDLFSERGYNPEYRVRADYEHFLWCFYEHKITTLYSSRIISSYEGGGFSETPENIKRSKAEHKEITKKYMSWPARMLYKGILVITLQPLRTRLAESSKYSGMYQKFKKLIYRQ